MNLKQLMALALAAVLLLCLTACGKEEEVMTETDSKYVEARSGGSIDITDVADLETGARMSCVVQGDTLYVSYNNIQNKSTEYFVAGDSSVTVVSKTTSDAPVIPTYRLSLWTLNADNKAQYVEGNMALLDADGSCYTCTFTGLEPGAKYKLTIGYATSQYYLSGLMTVSPLASADLTSVE